MFRWLTLATLTVAIATALRGPLATLTLSVPGELDERPSSTPEYAAIARHLRQPFTRYGALDVFVPQFAIVALSNMASGLLNVFLAEPEKRDEVRALAGEVVRRAVSAPVSPTGSATHEQVALDDHNLFWSHLALILGVERFMRCADAAGPSSCSVTELDRLQQRIVTHLVERSEEGPLFHARSYPGSPMWPADQTVTLLAIRLYDATHGTRLHDKPLQDFLAVLAARRDAETGLFPSSVSPTVATGPIPRGCATLWSIGYLAQLDPAIAREQYERAREALGRSVGGVGGFREWPRGRGGAMDVDSGPIVAGVGVAATAFGLGPARLFRDEPTYTVIRRSVLVFGVPAWWPSSGYVTAPLLGQAILFQGRTARPWFAWEGASLPALPTPLPFGPALVAFLEAAVLVSATRYLWREARKAWPTALRGRRPVRGGAG
jgi:hypothetical protein